MEDGGLRASILVKVHLTGRSESELSIFSFFFVGGFACWVGFPARRNAEQKFLGMFD